MITDRTEAGPTKTDIVIRLRDWENIYPEDNTENLGSLYLAAAEEIERLRDALRKIIALNSFEKAWEAYQAKDIARKALALIEGVKP